MIKKSIKIFCTSLVGFSLSATFASCSDFLKEYSQDTAYVRGYSDLDELLLGDGYMPTGIPTNIAELQGLYVGQQPYYYPYIHIMADEVDYNISPTGEGNITNGYPADKFFGYYTWQQITGISSDGTTLYAEDDDWKRIYKHINICNTIIATIDDISAKPNEEIEKQRIKGEAYFLRGAYYFTLANLYGKPYSPQTASSDLAVPIKLTEYVEDKLFERRSVEQVYSQAISDLKEAERLLQGTERKSYYRANQTAAKLLLSRIFLYKQDWAEAIKYSKEVIDAKDNHLEDLNTITADYFLNPELPEIIFTMGNGGMRKTLNSGAKAFSITPDFYSLYANDGSDLRTNWYVRPNAQYGNYPEYVKDGNSSARTALSANFLLRTSEAYLNLAEAAICNHDETTARNALNDLRKKRISTDAYTDINLSGQELASYIREERARELCLEGHRWFDLRRYAVNSVYPYVKTISHNYTSHDYRLSYVTWTYEYVPLQTRFFELRTDESAMTLPIPKEVIDFNIGMPNNERPDRQPVNTVNY